MVDDRPGRQLKKSRKVVSQTESLSEEEKIKRAKIANLLKIAEAITLDFVSGVYIDPYDPIEAERREFEWAIKDVSQDGIELDLTFSEPLYISTGEKPDTVVANFIKNDLWMDTENTLLEILPNGWQTPVVLPP